MNAHGFVKLVMAGSFAAAALAWWMKDELPPPARLQAGIAAEPRQVKVSRPPIDTSVNGVDYRIQPRYSYDMSALVVSLHDSDSWWDYAHKAWNDHVNLVDLCVIWGGSATNGAYRRISFSNDQWWCHWSTRSQEAWEALDQSEVANNHMVTDDAAIAKALRKVRVGDQIRVRGYLVNYATFKDGVQTGMRVSSESRTDTGNGACEVLYVESLDLLDSAGRGWRLALQAALGVLLLSVLLWLFLPVKFND